MRKRVIIGNWKMNTSVYDGMNLFEQFCRNIEHLPDGVMENVTPIICPPALHIKKLREMTIPEVKLGAQNIFWEKEGAYTGEISPAMLVGLAEYSIIGHSERRIHFGETDVMVNKKVRACFTQGIFPIVCIGESLEIREGGHFLSHVLEQVETALEGCSADEVSKCIVSYEPVWAIGTGVTASAEQAEEVNSTIRHYLGKHFSLEVADGIRLLYGGSTTAENIGTFVSQPNIDGAIVGGASLNAAVLAKMVEVAGTLL